MNIVWFSWKDIKHPASGGAEIVSDSIRTRLAQDGNTVTLYTARYKGSAKKELVSGVSILRYGNRYTVYILCLFKFLLSKRVGVDLVIDEMNTLPFWVGLITRKPKILLCYQLAREVWYYQLFKPLSYIGYHLEPLYVRLLSKIYTNAVTESKSTAEELGNYGFKNVHIFRIGMGISPLPSFVDVPKSQTNSVVFLGALRPMKRPLDAIMAFEKAKETIPSLRLTLVGSDRDKYSEVVNRYIDSSRFRTSINLRGSVSENLKKDILRNAAVVVVTSIKEGWGLVVTEAGAMCTPAVAYDTDGLRDSVVDRKTGLLATNSSVDDLSHKLVKIVSDKSLRSLYAKNAWDFSKQFTFDNSYKDFISIIEKVG